MAPVALAGRVLDVPRLHALARRRSATAAVEETLADAAAVATQEGLLARIEPGDRMATLLAWTEGRVDAAILDGRETESGLYGWVMLAAGRLVLVVPEAGLAPAAALLARLGEEARVAAILGATLAPARAAGLVGREHRGGALAPEVSLVHGPAGAEAEAATQLLWAGAHPIATLRLDPGRPLLAATGDPVEALALAGALALPG